MKTETPPPGAVFDLAERAVEYVRAAIGVTLDYSGDTLPVLDHYLRQVPHDQPETVELIAAASGAYFGEVVRRALDGAWQTSGEPRDWQLALPGGVRFSPVGFAAEAIMEDDVEGFDGGFEVPEPDRAAVQEAMEQRGQVSVDEYYSTCGRLELLMWLVDLVVGTHAQRAAPERPTR